MKKNIGKILRLMLPVFMLVFFLPAFSRTVGAVEQHETIAITGSEVFGNMYKVQGRYVGQDAAMFIDSANSMTISALQGNEHYIKKVVLEYSTSGSFDPASLSTNPESTVSEDHKTFTFSQDVYMVSFSSTAAADDAVRVTSVTVYYDDGNPEVPVQGITISTDEATTVNLGEKVAFTATISPGDATNKNVIWSVSDTNVSLYADEACETPVGTDVTSALTVYAKGVADGNATVTVTSNENAELSASCSVTVTSSVDFIKVQPKDVVVEYPDGAKFTVEVTDPTLVESYQWHMIDQKSNDFVMDGETGNDPTLVVASSVQRDQRLLFYCVIRDTQGNTHTTRRAILDQSNKDINKPVFYVGEYAVEPGESLDLATIYHDPVNQQYPLGSGIVTFAYNQDEKRYDITLDKVHFDNEHSTASIIGIGGNVGLDLEWQKPDPENVAEVNLILKGGENKIIDHLYQPQVNLSGIPLYFCFFGRDLQNAYSPTVNIIEDANDPGFLTVVNGTNQISALACLTIDADINLDQNRLMYSDGIDAFAIDIKEGHKFNLHTNGSVIVAKGDEHNKSVKADLTIRNAHITAYTREPHVGKGATTKHGIHAHNDLTIEDSIIDYQVEVDYDDGKEQGHQPIEEIAGAEFITGINTQIRNSKINLELLDHPDDIGHAKFAHHLIGLYGGTAVSVDNSEINMDLTSPIVFQVGGLKGGDISITNGSKVKVDVETMEGALAVYAEGNLTITDSDVDATAKNLAGNIITPFAISAARINIDLGENNTVVATADNNGDRVAIAGMHGPYFVFDDQEGPSSDAGEITLADDTFVVMPQNNKIDLADTTIRTEEPIEVKTVIDTANNKIADEVVIATKPIEDLYELVEGKAAEWGTDRGSVLQLRIERSTLDWLIKKHFKEVLVDGNTLSTEFYYLKTGSLIVQIKPVFLRQLSVGQHTVSVVFDDGRVDTVFIVVPQRYTPPVTGIE